MEQEILIQKLKLRLLIERVVFGTFAVIVVGGWCFSHFAGSKSLILVDGKPVVCVPSVRDAHSVIDSIKSKTGCDLNEIDFKQEVSVCRAPLSASPVSRGCAIRAVERLISPVVPRWSIIVNGKPVVAVPDKETAGKALELAKTRYGMLVKNLAEEPQFKESVTVDMAAISPSMYRKTAEQAVEFLFKKTTPTRRDAIYVVRDGDIASSIAAKNRMSLSELASMNPGRDLAKLSIGDSINLKACAAGRPKITVIVRDLEECTEQIPAPEIKVSSARLYTGQTSELSSGRSGLRKVSRALIYENGRKVGSEITEEQILRQPSPRQIAVGIKQSR